LQHVPMFSMAISGTDLLEVPTVCKSYVRAKFQGISPQNMAKNMVQYQYLHFRILEISHWILELSMGRGRSVSSTPCVVLWAADGKMRSACAQRRVDRGGRVDHEALATNEGPKKSGHEWWLLTWNLGKSYMIQWYIMVYGD
jgi:hypothetical protein